MVWQDTLLYNEGYRIFFQVMNPDGEMMFTDNGVPQPCKVGAHRRIRML